jgi:2-oxoisovalerate dehydrogenase E1 component
MLLARHLDRAAHELRASGHGHYTICSSGHEANVVLGRLTGPGDPSLLHYRSAALQIERARQVPELDPVRDIALSLVASSEEPASGGRHKVFGHPLLGIIPSTSTIASHAPRAVGLAFAFERKIRLGLASATNGIVVCSFGDASVNHSTLAGALNAASWVTYQHLKLPLLFVCEDNGIGISVRTPPGWVARRAEALPEFRVFSADGSSVDATYRAAAQAVNYCRIRRAPAFLHITCARLLGHAGSDVDTTYRSSAEIEAAMASDPVLAHALSIMEAGHLTTEGILAMDARAAERVDREAERAKSRPRLTSRTAIMSALVAPKPSQSAPKAADFCCTNSNPDERLTLAQGLNRALAEALESDPAVLVFGEDVAKKGGVYGISKGLFERFGSLRVFNTLLDEQTILGLALGAATLGMLPIPELQYLAYLHNAEDQLRGEAASFGFFSNGAYTNPMIVRIAGLAYQKGFGGHFHNDNSLAVLRDIPGISVVVPARADDALELFRASLRRARESAGVTVIVEPIALYHRRDLVAGDGGWLAQDSQRVAEFGRARVYRDQARDLVIVTYGNGLALALAAAEKLTSLHGLQARVLDLRWIVPLPEADVVEHARATGRVLAVDECRRSGNVSEAIGTLVAERVPGTAFARVAAADSFIPLGDAAEYVLVQEREILDAALRLTGPQRTPAQHLDD